MGSSMTHFQANMRNGGKEVFGREYYSKLNEGNLVECARLAGVPTLLGTWMHCYDSEIDFLPVKLTVLTVRVDCCNSEFDCYNNGSQIKYTVLVITMNLTIFQALTVTMRVDCYNSRFHSISRL